jgi:isoquinoline 1-oxidoreductase beta subunit
VLNAAAEKGDWGKPLPAGVHRGIAQFMGYGSYSAAVAEVSVSDKGKLKVHRLVLALELRPRRQSRARSRRRSRARWPMASPPTLYGEMPVEKGRMTNLNFDSYEIMRLAEMPKVETVHRADPRLLGRRRRADDLRGSRRAVMNAIFAATWEAGAQPAAQEREARVAARS